MASNQNDVQQANRVFNPNEHLMQIKSGQSSKDYLPVQWRLVWFRSAFPHGTIETEMIHLDLDRETEEEVFVWSNEKRRSEKVVKRAKGFVVFKATVKDGEGGVATGTKTEKAASFPDYIEKAETGSIGRALAALGYGTQFTGDEWNESTRIVDSPVDQTNGNASASNNGSKDTSSSNRPADHAAKSRSETNLTERKNGHTIPQSDSAVASSDYAASETEHSEQQGTPLSPSDLDAIRNEYAAARGIAEDQIEEKFPLYIDWLLHISQSDLKTHHLPTIRRNLKQQAEERAAKRRAATKGVTSKASQQSGSLATAISQ